MVGRMLSMQEALSSIINTIKQKVIYNNHSFREGKSYTVMQESWFLSCMPSFYFQYGTFFYSSGSNLEIYKIPVQSNAKSTPRPRIWEHAEF